MKNHAAAIAVVITVIHLLCGCANAPGDNIGDAEHVRATITRVADWQLTHQVPFGPRHWAIAPLYEGLIDTSLVTGDPRYLAAVIRAGERTDWRPGDDTYHADAQAVGHPWLRIYLMEPADGEVLKPFKDRFDEILRRRITEDLSLTAEPKTPGVQPTDRWTWADALYMAPPTMALLSRATGEERYLGFADQEFRATYRALYDPKEKLFYRDARFIDLRTPSGQKVFWSRGNGWVYAGLAKLLDAMPANYDARDFYVTLFQEMSGAILAAQQPDGFWYPNLKDPKQIAIGETSGTSLFVVGLAWGVRTGLLERETYWPAVVRGWNALLTRIGPHGGVGFVQPVGAGPEDFSADSVQAFGTGAVLMAGSEIVRAMNAEAHIELPQLRQAAEKLAASAPDLSQPSRRERDLTATGAEDRAYCVAVLTHVAEPVLEALSKGELKKRMPVHDWEQHRAAWTHYEAFARTLAGMAPWLELGPDDTPEGQLRERFIVLARESLINATDPQSPDFLNFGEIPDQPLVESAYLSYALLVAPKQLWEPLTPQQRTNVLNALKTSRTIELKHNNNWFLFPAMVEAALWRLEGKANPKPIEVAGEKARDWYVGDGMYGDGPRFQWDYYNSYDIHPMLLQVMRVAEEMRHPLAVPMSEALRRARRNAEILERLISPEGTFPVMGRSSAYRFAAFFHLADMALHKQLPQSLDPGAVRAGITAVVRRMIEAPGTFDEDGWLRLGAVGFQPGLQETYNSTGSLYICLTGLVHLGLPADDPLWTAPPAPWTQRRIWFGDDRVQRDRGLKETDRLPLKPEYNLRPEELDGLGGSGVFNVSARLKN